MVTGHRNFTHFIEKETLIREESSLCLPFPHPVPSKRTSDIFSNLIPLCLAVRLGRGIFFSEVVSSQANGKLDYLTGLSRR